MIDGKASIAYSMTARVPPIWPQDRAFSDRLFVVHALIAVAIACLAAAHIRAALHHHFVRKDRILMRMITV